MWSERGHTVFEMAVVMLLLGVMLAMSPPLFEARRREAYILGAGRVFKGEFLKARSVAVRQNAYVAIRFERGADGRTSTSTYLDGDDDGVRAADIRSGVDRRISGPVHLTTPERVEVAIQPNTPELPPERGLLDTTDPIRFAHDTVSFSPVGTATPGTFYLAGSGVQGAVRVTPGSARVRLMIYRGRVWEER